MSRAHEIEGMHALQQPLLGSFQFIHGKEKARGVREKKAGVSCLCYSLTDMANKGKVWNMDDIFWIWPWRVIPNCCASQPRQHERGRLRAGQCASSPAQREGREGESLSSAQPWRGALGQQKEEGVKHPDSAAKRAQRAQPNTILLTVSACDCKS